MSTERKWTDDEVRELVPEIDGWEDFPMISGEVFLLNLLCKTRLELKEARGQLASVADDALEYALMARSEVIDDNRPRYQRQRDLIDADLAKFRAIIDGHPAPPETQAPSLAGKRTLDLRAIPDQKHPFVGLAIIDQIRAQLPDVEVLT